MGPLKSGSYYGNATCQMNAMLDCHSRSSIYFATVSFWHFHFESQTEPFHSPWIDSFRPARVNIECGRLGRCFSGFFPNLAKFS